MPAGAELLYLALKGPPDVRPKDSLGMRFGVVGADHELEIRLRVAKRQPNDAATPTSARV